MIIRGFNEGYIKSLAQRHPAEDRDLRLCFQFLAMPETLNLDCKKFNKAPSLKVTIICKTIDINLRYGVTIVHQRCINIIKN